MAINFTKILTGLGLIPNASQKNSEAGDLEVRSDDSNRLHYHNGTVDSAVSTEATLAPQLAAKVDANTAITGATNTKITYDSKGLVTAGAQAQFSDIGGSVAGSQLPNPSPTSLGGVNSKVAVANQFLTQIGTDGSISSAQPAFTDISGTASASQLPDPTSTTKGGVKSKAAVANQFLTEIGTDGTPASAQPSFANISGTVADTQLPTPTATTLGGVKSKAAVASNFLTQIGTDGSVSQAQPAFSDISGSVAASQLPNPSATTLGGVKSKAAVTSNFLTQIDTDGSVSQAQPAFTDISGTAAISQGGTGQTTRTAAFDALAPATPAAGDILVFDGTNWVKQSIGNNGDVLTVDTALTDKIKWSAPTSGGGFTPAYLAGYDGGDWSQSSSSITDFSGSGGSWNQIINTGFTSVSVGGSSPSLTFTVPAIGKYRVEAQFTGRNSSNATTAVLLNAGGTQYGDWEYDATANYWVSGYVSGILTASSVTSYTVKLQGACSAGSNRIRYGAVGVGRSVNWVITRIE